MRTRRLAITFGITWGAMLFALTILNLSFGYATNFLNIWVGLYPGYSLSLVGSLIGFVYGFVDLFIGVYITVWIYHQVCKYLK